MTHFVYPKELLIDIKETVPKNHFNFQTINILTIDLKDLS
jgi:hypothetical protein